MNDTGHQDRDNESIDPDKIAVRNNAEAHRFELLDNDSMIGATHWISYPGPGGDQRIFYHTTVDKAYGGHGLASKLVQEALDETTENGISVVAVCPYVKKWLQEHPDHPAIRITPRPEHLQAIKSAAGD